MRKFVLFPDGESWERFFGGGKFFKLLIYAAVVWGIFFLLRYVC